MNNLNTNTIYIDGLNSYTLSECIDSNNDSLIQQITTVHTTINGLINETLEVNVIDPNLNT